jgi:hypothetical protein
MSEDPDTDYAPEWVWVRPGDEKTAWFTQQHGTVKRRVFGWKVNHVLWFFLALVAIDDLEDLVLNHADNPE